ncbi:PIN domain-containing protein [Tenacibaculum finnmarkense genomovar finnmarkense]|uniref:type II toxin-antitoxin system VapC family toxin n=1 Tax=Tenacibaculum finnmarkense TaxID=2781243 RepID=UPI001E3A1A96|nr:PIN domain-containing protein [Tenacibaculum finnmarkense]MCD8417976.1 PIN domain-containing protein [Tenacibaculum finnmarkense genomovar finnmarkense]MCD8452884.1 PIN domain-containing protein [Tenacibaculum finnmarkense genomovar ulcerans]MCG8186363.1 PIN domain-containing protein [Tenacibaculum finnmarkense genomovar finnmarkense]MCG8202906.1 PIN domain-containing protein [Tenacibaculum finnmarkense genomovar finnmarkense]MCG8210164.1 PIN domain-containing protein [Tenacibaculum finnmar
METIDSKGYSVKSTDNLFFDANVWLYIHGPLAEFSIDKQSKFSSFFEKVARVDAMIWINLMVISEIANVIIRDRFKKYKKDTNNHSLKFKEYWKSNHKKSAIQDAKDIIYNILDSEFVQQLPDNFNSIDVKSDLGDYYGILDFNDASIAHICIEKRYKIVTDDRDFIGIPNLIVIN